MIRIYAIREINPRIQTMDEVLDALRGKTDTLTAQGIVKKMKTHEMLRAEVMQ